MYIFLSDIKNDPFMESYLSLTYVCLELWGEKYNIKKEGGTEGEKGYRVTRI